jgi:hypothetical protein
LSATSSCLVQKQCVYGIDCGRALFIVLTYLPYPRFRGTWFGDATSASHKKKLGRRHTHTHAL